MCRWATISLIRKLGQYPIQSVGRICWWPIITTPFAYHSLKSSSASGSVTALVISCVNVRRLFATRATLASSMSAEGRPRILRRSLSEKWMKKLAIKPQKRSWFLKLISWALYHRAEFQRLDSVVLLIDNIEKLFPAPQAQIMLVRQEAGEIGDKAFLKLR